VYIILYCIISYHIIYYFVLFYFILLYIFYILYFTCYIYLTYEFYFSVSACVCIIVSEDEFCSPFQTCNSPPPVATATVGVRHEETLPEIYSDPYRNPIVSS